MSMQEENGLGTHHAPKCRDGAGSADSGGFRWPLGGVCLAAFCWAPLALGLTGRPRIEDEGGAMSVNREVLTKDGEGMWILEGDEVLAVGGTPCEGDLDKIVDLVMDSPGDRVTITLSRNYLKPPKGPIKVVFRPSGGMATVGRGNNFSDIASSVQENVHYSCEEGWCGSCWHREAATGKVVRMCQDEVPGVWDNVMPMMLVAAPETNRKEVIDKDGDIFKGGM